MKSHGQVLLSSAAQIVRRLMPDTESPQRVTGIVLGSGLSGFGDELVQRGGHSLPYDDVPGMPLSRVAGHGGRLIAGHVGDQAVVVLQGRVHGYEGFELAEVTWGVRVLCAAGIHDLILTNAAGGIPSTFRPGDLMLIEGHLQFPTPAGMWAKEPPRSGMPTPAFESPRLVTTWNAGFLELAASVPTTLTVHRGVYAMMPGPDYETPAEIRMLQVLGADAVGMSTVPEAMCAAACGIPVLGVSCITNIAAGLSDTPLDHSDVTTTAQHIEPEFTRWLWGILQQRSRRPSHPPL